MKARDRCIPFQSRHIATNNDEKHACLRANAKAISAKSIYVKHNKSSHIIWLTKFGSTSQRSVVRAQNMAASFRSYFFQVEHVKEK